ncbi:MAG TPA: Asp-tRNA(Asn)/Glu-tRNA(Gln) amidotransferase subunit GatC [Kiritimatiellia bacterium]|nr:Asp-tRNA(Asn)/Glu-tRNA(Gln) amidotransferase subunit GatC [Kiritimatiellia bacterium]
MSDTPTPPSGFDVTYVARLARLRLADDERARLQAQLEQILAYVDELKQVDVSGLAPMTQAVDAENVLRTDAVSPGLAHDAVMANAPEQRLGQFVVPRIIE